jgi:hypothetical protein
MASTSDKGVAATGLERAAEVATGVIGDAAGAIADPKTATAMLKRKIRSRAAALAALALVIAVVALKARSRS